MIGLHEDRCFPSPVFNRQKVYLSSRDLKIMYVEQPQVTPQNVPNVVENQGYTNYNQPMSFAQQGFPPSGNVYPSHLPCGSSQQFSHSFVNFCLSADTSIMNDQSQGSNYCQPPYYPLQSPTSLPPQGYDPSTVQHSFTKGYPQQQFGMNQPGGQGSVGMYQMPSVPYPTNIPPPQGSYPNYPMHAQQTNYQPNYNAPGCMPPHTVYQNPTNPTVSHDKDATEAIKKTQKKNKDEKNDNKDKKEKGDKTEKGDKKDKSENEEKSDKKDKRDKEEKDDKKGKRDKEEKDDKKGKRDKEEKDDKKDKRDKEEKEDKKDKGKKDKDDKKDKKNKEDKANKKKKEKK